MKPYTYLIGWSALNKWYYGVRYAKGCVPEDLWVKYFTSSKRVAAMRTEFGEPSIVLNLLDVGRSRCSGG